MSRSALSIAVLAGACAAPPAPVVEPTSPSVEPDSTEPASAEPARAESSEAPLAAQWAEEPTGEELLDAALIHRTRTVSDCEPPWDEDDADEDAAAELECSEAVLTLRWPEGRSLDLLQRTYAVGYDCEDLSWHVVVVDGPRSIVDARLNCHNGEDHWWTEVDAVLLRIHRREDPARAEVLWRGSETYRGAMGECLSGEDTIRYELVEGAIWVTQTSFAEYRPEDPRDPLVPRSECEPHEDVTARKKVF